MKVLLDENLPHELRRELDPCARDDLAAVPDAAVHEQVADAGELAIATKRDDILRCIVDMQAAVFPGELTDIYAQATPRLLVPNGNDAWYLADLLEHYGINWGGWTDLLTKWQANRATASQLRVYSLSDLLRPGG